MSIISWLRENAQWVFSGVGVALLLLVVSAVSRLRISRKYTVTITSPAPESHVPREAFVTGQVRPSSAVVVVVVHPMVTSGYWVQRQVTVRADGTWRVQVYVGSVDASERGARFEIVAVAEPAHTLRDGDVLNNWPQARCRSDVVEVQRQ